MQRTPQAKYRYLKHSLLLIGVFSLGLLAGGYLFSKSVLRSFLAAADCQGTCTKPNDVAGLLASAAIHHAPTLIPNVELESNECVAVRHPRPEARVHIVLFPKRDAKNITEVVLEDQPYVFGCFALARALVARFGIQNYRLTTNGPALQHMTYLHFNLIAK